MSGQGGFPFRECGATNEPETCIWCGRKLRGKKTWLFERYGKLGDYADGYFCTLRCGYDFGLTLATKGERLRPKVSR